MIVWSAIRSFLAALVLAAVFGAIFTLESVYSNPGGIFRTEEGVQWQFVVDTFTSWFFPTLASCFGAFFVVVLAWRWIRHRVRRQ